MSWVCDIPGASPAVSAWHLGLQLGLAAFVVGAGVVFLVSAHRPRTNPCRGPRRATQPSGE